VSVELLAEYAAVSKYGVWLKDKGRRETWPESVARVRDMMVEAYPHMADRVRSAYERVEARKILGSQRAMQFGGPPILRKHERIYNCAYLYVDRLRAFQEAFYLLLCGCGVGFSAQERHTRYLPLLSNARRAGRVLPRKVFRVPDSIEGWADCAGALLSSYHETPVKGFEQYHDAEVEFDTSLVRPKGTPLSFGIGKAPGPKPLETAIGRARAVLGRAAASGGERLGSVDVYDVLMHFADSVVSGGVRRSATICLFDRWDRSMAAAKTGDWYMTNPQRGRSNNSAVLVRGEVSYDEFRELFENTRHFGEPGFFWADDADVGTNPCCEIGLYPRLAVEGTAASTRELLENYDGPVLRGATTDNTLYLSGIQFCNLSTINARTLVDADDFVERAEWAAEIGTYQAGFTRFPYLGEVSERITRHEALLGVSINGMMHAPEITLDPAVQRRAAAAALARNAEVAALLGINPAARVTCVKPEGNSSSLLGCDPGIHPSHSPRYFRHVQANRMEAPYQHFRRHNPAACEPSLWSANGTDDVIAFLVEPPAKSRFKHDTPALELLRAVKLTQENWVAAGKRPERCAHPGLNHNVSNTVHVNGDSEWEAARDFIFRNQHAFTGVSLIAHTGDKDYAQAPYTAVYDRAEQDARYGPEAVAGAEGLVDDHARFGLRHLWLSCDVALGLREPDGQLEAKWAGALKRDLAEAHLGGDVKGATYAVKDAYNWRKWCRLEPLYKPVRYEEMVEREATITMRGEVACAGGACLI
jgi:ribonucleoside-triphosphate reductase